MWFRKFDFRKKIHNILNLDKIMELYIINILSDNNGMFRN